MSRRAIHQVMAGFADGDAISHMATLMRDIFRGLGHDSEIYADLRHVSPSLRGQCRALEDYTATASDLCIHHFGIDSPAVAVFARSPARKIMVYHNITPPEFFRGFDDRAAGQLERAHRAVVDLGRRCAAVWAVSRFNASDLAGYGLAHVDVLPLPFNRAPLDTPPDPMISGKFLVKMTNLLFVGRIAPNKRIEDLIQAFAWYQRAINPYSRLLLVGSQYSSPRYYNMLRMFVGDLDLTNVYFEGFASDAGLSSYYQHADVYVSASAHEGFCLPLLEAMYRQVPVIARSVGGVPEALDGAGVAYDELDACELAELIHRVVSDQALRARVLAAQQRRIDAVLNRPLADELTALLKPHLG